MVNVYTYLENLFKENYTLPIIIATISIAVLIPLYQDYQESKQKKALEEGQKEKKKEADSSADNTSSKSADSKPKAFALPTT